MRTPDDHRAQPLRFTSAPLRALVWVGLCAGLLAGCAALPPAQLRGSVAAPPRPSTTLPADPLSDDLAAYYRRIEAERVDAGLMRRDDGAPEGPISAAVLARNYIDIALHDEYLRTGGGFASRTSASTLRRWQAPVVMRLEFGANVPAAMRQTDHAQVARLVQRMAEAARHSVSLLPHGQAGGANFHILVLTEVERRAIGPRLRDLVPGIDEAAVRLVTDLPRDAFCLAMAFARDGADGYSEAVVIIRAEHPTLTRLACYHEELAQGLGLANDSPNARPSVFNDDQEFAFLTTHDLLLLRIHYDPRLRPGMTANQARPIVQQIAAELVAGSS